MKSQRRSPRWWLLASVVLLGLAGLVLHTCGGTPEVEKRPPPEFPHAMRPAETQRMTQREVLPVRHGQQRARDPVLVALSAPDAGMAIVLEANALRYSPLGQLLLNCFASLEGSDGGASALEAIRARGLDPLRDLDRVAFADDNAVLSGDFSRMQWDGMAGSAEPYGAQGQIRSLGASADGGEGSVLASWGTQLVMVSPSRAVAMATLDRIEGRGPGAQLLGDDQAYGDAYGVVTGGALGEMFGADAAPLSAQLQSAARNVEFHLDATQDVVLVATATGDDPDRLQDLGKALGGAVALSRSEAILRGDTLTAELLEYAQVTPRGQKVDLELSLPLATLKKMLANCGQPPTDAGP